MVQHQHIEPLVKRLGRTCTLALDAASGLCLSRTNYNVEIEHWLLKLLDVENSDLPLLCRYFEIDVSKFRRELLATIDGFQVGNGRTPSLSPDLIELIKVSWLVASLELKLSRVRSGILLYAMILDGPSISGRDHGLEELAKIRPGRLRRDLEDITRESIESEETATEKEVRGAETPLESRAEMPALDQYTANLTALARAGELDPVLGRDEEIRQLVDILSRRRQNNPILTGDAGVGKTAIVEGFAQRIVAGEIPEALRKAEVRALDLTLLAAGAGVKGEFENRLKGVIEGVKACPYPIILFIDEAHTLIGAGGQAGQGDAANMLKPALARGELRTIAATTWNEYKEYFEKDAALTRRFRVVRVEEPSEEVAIGMLRGTVDVLEQHHGITMLDDSVVEAVRLSKRYLTERQLPEKAVSVLDEACARVRLSRSVCPPEVEDYRRRIQLTSLHLRLLKREFDAETRHEEKVRELMAENERLTEGLEDVEGRWKEELRLVEELAELQKESEPGDEGSADGSGGTGAGNDPRSEASGESRDRFQRLVRELEALQGPSPLVRFQVDAGVVAEIIAGETGIPVQRMLRDEIDDLLSLEGTLQKRIVGQTHAIQGIASRIQTSRSLLVDPRRPIGVFLLVGPSGVGKTETALALAEQVYGSERNMTVINMSEFKEEHKVSLLLGSPPGYVGYGKGGVLTEAVRRRPYSVVLLDEIEKAHPGVQDIFYQVFDKGVLRDGEGRDVDFKNTVILMTSNAASEEIVEFCSDSTSRPDPTELAEAVYSELLRSFKPAFLGRMTVLPYYPLTDEEIREITILQLDRVADRVRENHEVSFSYDEEVLTEIVKRCSETSSGARNIDQILNRTLLAELATEFLSRIGSETEFHSVRVAVNAKNRFEYVIE